MFSQCFGMLQVCQNEISLPKWSGGTAHFRGTEKTQRLSSQVPHKLREFDVSMVKVVSAARRAVAVRCIGCGANGQLWRGYSCRAQMAMTFNCHGPRGSRREGKRKTRQKRNLLRVAITLSWSTHTHYKDTRSLIWLWPRCKFHGDWVHFWR